MSLVAAIGYAIGIMIFAIFFRLRRKKMLEKFMDKTEATHSKSEKGMKND